jgi:hypothetical protein
MIVPDPVQTTKLRQHLRGGRIYRVEDILNVGDSKPGDSAWVTRKEAPMKQSLHHGHFAAWSVLVLVFGLALLCPDLAVATDRPVYGGLGGNYFRAECPKGSYLVGLAGRAGEWVDRIAPVCAPWLRGSQTFGAQSVGQFFGTSMGGQERHESCLGSGINKRAIQSWWIHLLRSDNHFVQFVQVYCTSLTSPVSADSGHRLDFGSKPDSVEEMVTGGPFNSQPPFQACPAGEVAVGFGVRAGLFVDALGLICGPLPAKLSAPVKKVIPGARAPVSPPATKANPLVKGPSDDMFTITRPAWNDRVQQGNLIVAAKQPKIGMTPVTELEFKWLDAPKNQPYVNKFPVDTPKLLQLQGYPINQQVTRGNAGRWEVRARISGKTPPGPWSFPVRFHLFLTQPTQSRKKASPVQQTAPLPSTSVTQPSPVPQTSPLPPSSATQAPAQGGSAPTQMRRSSSMIIPRGVEENESVEPAPETEKKP